MKYIIIITLLSLLPHSSVTSAISDSPWKLLKESSKKVRIIRQSKFDMADEDCQASHGHLLYLYDGDDALKVARDLMERNHQELDLGFWIGAKRMKGYSHPFRWISGGGFYQERFNMSKPEEHHRSDLCAEMRIFRRNSSHDNKGYKDDPSPVGYNIEFDDCSKIKWAVCQAKVNPYEAMAITSTVLSGICFLVLLVFLIVWIRRRFYTRSYVPPGQEKPSHE